MRERIDRPDRAFLHLIVLLAEDPMGVLEQPEDRLAAGDDGVGAALRDAGLHLGEKIGADSRTLSVYDLIHVSVPVFVMFGIDA